MDSAPNDDRDTARPRRGVPLWLAVGVSVLLVMTSVMAVYFAARAADATADLETLSDGVDRSRLPRDEAVALAKLSLSRSADLPHDAGHDDDHGDSSDAAAELSAEEGETLASQLATATAAIPRYATPEEAQAHGYVQASGETDGVGTHWVKWSIVDRPFDPENPSMLLFDELKWGHGPELIAYSYWVASPEEPEGFAGDTDHWHVHLGMCFENGWLTTDNRPREECEEGDWINGSDLWMLHAWIVPGVENPLGQFATVNPKLCERACALED